MFCCFSIFVKEQKYKLSTVVQRTAAVGSKFHCTKCLWCADRMQMYTNPYWFEFVCNGKYVYVWWDYTIFGVYCKVSV